MECIDVFLNFCSKSEIMLVGSGYVGSSGYKLSKPSQCLVLTLSFTELSVRL